MICVNSWHFIAVVKMLQIYKNIINECKQGILYIRDEF